jgi:hypothetical protein
MKRDDYLVCSTATDKGYTYFMARAIKPIRDTEVLVQITKDFHIDGATATIDRAQIVLELGPKPHDGMLYGCDTSRRLFQTVSWSGGEIYFLTEVKQAIENYAVSGLEEAGKLLKQHGASYLLKLPLVFEVKKNPKAKYAGRFIKSRGHSIIELNLLDSLTTAKEDFSSYVFLHELGHALDYHYLMDSNKLRARWVRFYMQSCRPTSLSNAEAKKMFSTINKGTLTEWKKSFEEEDKPKCNLIMRYIKQAHNVGPQEVNDLLLDEDYATVKSLWPTGDLHSVDIEPLVTEYATKNVKETIAECFALFLTGKKLPKIAAQLVEDSIAFGAGKFTDA